LLQSYVVLTLSPESLRRALETDPALHGLYRAVADERPHLFAQTPFFVCKRFFAAATTPARELVALALGTSSL
jgi:hypothetical protein